MFVVYQSLTSSSKDSIGKQRDVVREAEVDHLVLRPRIKQRVLHLMTCHLYSRCKDLFDPQGVKVRESDVSDLPFRFELREIKGCINKLWLSIITPVKLHEINRGSPYAAEGPVNSSGDVVFV